MPDELVERGTFRRSKAAFANNIAYYVDGDEDKTRRAGRLKALGMTWVQRLKRVFAIEIEALFVVEDRANDAIGQLQLDGALAA